MATVQCSFRVQCTLGLQTPRYPPRAEATGTCDAFWLNETTIADGDAGAKAGSAEETASGNGVKGEGGVAGEAAERAAATVGTVWGWGSLEGLAGMLLQWAGLACEAPLHVAMRSDGCNVPNVPMSRLKAKA